MIHVGSISSKTDISEVPFRTLKESSYLHMQDTLVVYKNFEARIDMLSKEEGGRQTAFFNNFQPSFKIENVKILGVISLPSSIQMIRPGDTRHVSIKLTSSVELKEGQQFEIYEIEKKIGTGTVLKLIK